MPNIFLIFKKLVRRCILFDHSHRVRSFRLFYKLRPRANGNTKVV